MKDRQEERRKTAGLTISLVVHGILLLILFFIVAWREPNPPIPEYGIELSFGIQTQGQSNSKKQVSSPSPKPVQETLDDTEETTEESSVEQPSDEPIETEVEDIEPLLQESNVETVASPDIEDVEEAVESASAESQQEEQETTEEPETPSENEESDNENSPEKNNEQEESSGNNGEKTIDDRALYGKKEGTSTQGSFLNITGWTWDSKPRPNDTSTENGKIVFQIVIDEGGDIIGIKTILSTVTPAVEKVYKDEVARLTFTPTSDNFAPAPSSKGEITFIIKSR